MTFQGPLTGTRVVDLTRFVSGSYATMLLSSLGADVIKIEGLPGGDPYRRQGTAFASGHSVLFQSLNTGKRSLALNLKSQEGAVVVSRLLASADVLVENGRPGSLAGIGLDAGAVRGRYPNLVYGSISGYGQTGPDASRGGFDLILQAEAGLMSVTGSPESGPVKVGAPLLDIGSGVSCALAIVSALLQRTRTGHGEHVSSSLLEFAMAGFTSVAPAYLQNGELPGLLGSHSPVFAPYGAFRARDGYVVLAGAGSEDLWRRLCGAIARPDLVEDERFITNADRVRDLDALIDVLEQVLGSDDVEAWLLRLAAAGVPATRVKDLGQVLSSPQVGHLGLVRRHETDGPTYPTMAPPFTVGGPLQYPRGAPTLGQHTREILDELGFEEADVVELVRAGCVGAT